MIPATEQKLITGHSFRYDISQGGAAVIDPEGDPLTYAVRILLNGAVQLSEPPDGLTLQGTVISGVPATPGYYEVQADVTDGRSGTGVSIRFGLRIVANAAPIIVHANNPQLQAVATQISYDASQAGMTFVDPDGDPLSYVVTLRGSNIGLTTSGSKVEGTLQAVGATEATIMASDGFGGTASDSFLVAVPANLTTSPILPSTLYVYRDEELPLPFIFTPSGTTQFQNAGTQPVDNEASNAGAALGRVLFYDKRLSLTNTVSCATCHNQSHGFATATQFNSGILGIPLERNAMGLANVRFSIHLAWFSDMRIRDDLRMLIPEPIENHDELGMPLGMLEEKLQATSYYPPLFQQAFGSATVTADRISRAIAQFLQSILAYRSRADQALNPMANVTSTPSAVLNAEEMQGLQLYSDHCDICHRATTGANVWQANNGLDFTAADPGILNPGLKQNSSRGVFRAASLRNIAVTAPYMHDGRFATLREIINHYSEGVVWSPDLDGVLLRSGNTARHLNLSPPEKNALEAFLLTFTDSALLTDPKFSDPFPP